MLLDIKHFNQLDSILAVVTAAGGVNATVAGGAVRDSVLEKPIADIDVFFEGELDKAVVEKAFGMPEPAKKNPPPPISLNYVHVDDYIAAYTKWEESCPYKDEDGIPYEGTFSIDNYKGDLFSFDGLKVQLIGVADVDEHIHTFPCYLSRMLYSEGCLVIPKEAIQDASLGIVRFTEGCSEKYQKKIEEKYSDYL